MKKMEASSIIVLPLLGVLVPRLPKSGALAVEKEVLCVEVLVHKSHFFS
jgi:hypothetical protein